MSLRIQNDHSRFKDIVKGKIKSNLRNYVKNGELIGKQGKDTIKIPVPRIEMPRFRFGSQQQGGVGQGKGEPGDPVDGTPQKGEGEPGEAGSDPGEHGLEVDVSLDELADLLGEELGLPRIEPKGTKITSIDHRFSGITNVGPQSLMHFKRTFKEALKRQISTRTYKSKNPMIVPIKSDKRFRSWTSIEKPQSNATLIYMMDVSGSMGQEQKDIVRLESFWIDTWLRRNYDGIETRYIIHDAAAREVDENTFFHTRESGGTMISTAYELCAKIIKDDYPVDDWNIYTFHFSDGDNWSVDDTRKSIALLKDHIIPVCNQFSYGQVDSPYGSGQFIKYIKEHFSGDEKVVCSEIKDREAILGSIKEFLSSGQ